MSRLAYNDSESAAFNLADKLADDVVVSKDELRQLLNLLGYESHRARQHLDRALTSLSESNKQKREGVKRLIEMERSAS